MALKTHPTEILIHEARTLLQPTPVRLHHLPRWFTRRIKLALGKAYRKYYALDDLLEAASLKCDQRYAVSWWDHWGSTTLKNGREAVVTEPYLCIDHVKVAIAFAKLLKCDVDISGNSWWYPGQTIRIAFTEPKESQETP